MRHFGAQLQDTVFLITQDPYLKLIILLGGMRANVAVAFLNKPDLQILKKLDVRLLFVDLHHLPKIRNIRKSLPDLFAVHILHKRHVKLQVGEYYFWKYFPASSQNYMLSPARSSDTAFVYCEISKQPVFFTHQRVTQIARNYLSKPFLLPDNMHTPLSIILKLLFYQSKLSS
jgi:hypothetical protein